jgi:diguanylate cyclase (GGDEF)-like protein
MTTGRRRRADVLGHRVATRAWRWFLTAGAAAVAVCATPLGADVRSMWYEATAFAAVAAVLVGLQLHGVRRRTAWHLLAGGIALFGLGDLVFSANGSLFGATTFPSMADVVYLAAYPLLIAAVVLLTRERLPGQDIDSVLDASALAVAAGLPYWVFIVAPAALDRGMSPAARAVSVAYPVLDVVLIAVLARHLVLGVWRSPSAVLLVAGIGLNLVADTIYGLPSVSSRYQSSGEALDLVYLASYVLLGAAALHPSIARASPLPKRRPSLSGWRIAALGGAGLMAPVMLAVEWHHRHPQHVIGVLVGWIVVTGLLLARLVGMMRAVAVEAQLDPLTRLPNRTVLLDRLDQLLSSEGGAVGDVAVLYLDLDRFKEVNDELGHASGDILLVELADRLRRAVRPGDMVGRLGGDEFVVVCRGVTDEPTARAVADRLGDSLREPFWIEGQPRFVSASIGISRPSADADRAATLLREADLAMYRAKVGGPARAELFDPSMRLELSLRGRFERDLYVAIEQDQLVLHYQPLVDLPAGDVVGVEAVLRWHHPDWGTTKPDSLLPIAEDSGLIVPIGRWVLEEACRQLSIWDRRLGGHTPGEVTVNVTVRELLDPSFLEHLSGSLDHFAIEPGRLVLDVSDRYLASAPSAVMDVLSRARGLGVHVCIDEFGVGEASLAHLGRVPADRLKVHRSFLTQLPDEPGDRLVVSTVLRLGESLGLEVIAAGVETRSQRSQLERMGCTKAQGHLWAPPLPPGAVLDSVLGLVVEKRS